MRLIRGSVVVNEALLAILSTLVGALIFVVKWLVNRSDKQLEKAQEAVAKRDEHIGKLIEVATEAIDQLKETQGQLREQLDMFGRFEKEEERIHAELQASTEVLKQNDEKLFQKLDTHETLLQGIVEAQKQTAELLGGLMKELK